MGWLDETPDKDARVQLLVALRDITDGKIFVEAQRAKLTRMLAKVSLRVAGHFVVSSSSHPHCFCLITEKTTLTSSAGIMHLFAAVDCVGKLKIVIAWMRY